MQIYAIEYNDSTGTQSIINSAYLTKDEAFDSITVISNKLAEEANKLRVDQKERFYLQTSEDGISLVCEGLMYVCWRVYEISVE